MARKSISEVEDRLCRRCFTIKPASAFGFRKKGEPARKGQCRKCDTVVQLERLRTNEAYRVKQEAYQNSEKGKQVKTEARRRNVIGGMLNAARSRALSKGVPFTIHASDIELNTHCPCCGVTLCQGLGRRRDNSHSLDKIVNDLGYVPGNIWVICMRCNMLKGDSKPYELRRIADAVESKIFTL